MRRNVDFLGVNNQSGMGYVIIPKDVDRTAFVEMCYRTRTIFMVMLDGRYFEKVKVSDNIMSYLEFPDEPDGLGSTVVWITEKIYRFPIVVGVIPKPDTMGDLGEYQWTIGRSSGENDSNISGNADVGVMVLDVTAAGEGQIKISSDDLLQMQARRAQLEGGLVDLVVREEVKTTVQEPGEDKKAEFGYKLGEGYDYEDEFGTHVNVDSKILVENGDGYSVKDLLDDIITEISSITVATALGTQAILNKVQVEQLKQKVAQIFK
jgi:hypothetical protein